MSITLTPRAATELKDLIASQGKTDVALRIWVAGGGCSGLSYGMGLEENQPEADDNIFEVEGVKVVVDALSLNYMQGSTVDYIDDDLGGGFKIDNPNAISSCGCGSSFKTEGEGGAPGCGGCSG